MLPFLEPKKMSTLIMAKTKPSDEEAPQDDMPKMGLHAAAQDLIDAIHAKDVEGVASALEAAHDINSSGDGEGEAEGDDELG